MDEEGRWADNGRMERRMHPWRMDEQQIKPTRLYNTIQNLKKK